jgi:hypothetical protein
MAGLLSAMPWRAHPKRAVPPSGGQRDSETSPDAETAPPGDAERGDGLVLTDAMCGLCATVKPPRPNA